MSAPCFIDHINTWTLRFKEPALEAIFLRQKEKDFAMRWPRGIVLLITSIWIVTVIIRLANNGNNNHETLLGAWAAVLLMSVVAVGLEFITHIIWCLRYIRGLFLCSGALLAGAITGASVYSAPVLQPGSIVMFVLAIFSNLHFAYGWRWAVFNQVLGHATMSIYLGVRYASLLNNSEVFMPLINANLLLLFLPLYFYFAERDKRQIPFFPRILVHRLDLPSFCYWM